MCAQDEIALNDRDIRAMVRLLGEVAAVDGNHNEKKRELMDGLCSLLNADFWVWALAAEFEPGEQPIYTALATGGFAADQFPKLLVAYEHPDLAEMTEPLAREVKEFGRQVTRVRPDYDPNDFFSSSDANPLWRHADVGPPLVCYRPVANDCVSGIALYRSYERPLFDRREAKIAHIILGEVPWLHEQGWPWSSARKVPSLPHRCRLVLNLMLEGLPRKLIADQMNLSIHTVNDYAKKIYAYFGVRSHPELLRRFQTSDGGHTP